MVVHEFGHSFGGLADEYFYDDDDLATAMYRTDVEPWEQNLTTLADFPSKWQDMLAPSVSVPTPAQGAGVNQVGVYEGGGYQSKGCIVRPSTAVCAPIQPKASVQCARELSAVL